MLKWALIFLLVASTITIATAGGPAALAGGLLKVAVAGFAILAVVGLLALAGQIAT